MIDEAAHRHPYCPLEPILRAIINERPTFNFSVLDIIVDQRLLRTLLDFVMGSDETFEFGVENVESTVCLTRKEPRTQMDITKDEPIAFEEAFMYEYTDLSEAAGYSTSHHRVIAYSLGGLQVLVSSAVDACIENEHLVIHTEYPKNWTLNGRPIRSSDLPLRPSTRKSAGCRAGRVTVINGGRRLPNSAMLDWRLYDGFTKSRTSLSGKLADLWLAQVYNHVTAEYEMTGKPEKAVAFVKRVDLWNVHEQIREWEQDNQVDLRRLIILLGRILVTARSNTCPLILRRQARAAELEVWKVEAGDDYPAIPEDLREKWNDTAITK